MTSDSYSPEKTKLIADNGWDKGLVLFGFLASEATAKVHTALRLTMALDNDFGYNQADLVHVNLTFDNKPLKTDKSGKKSIGVRSDEWLIMSDNKGYMPALMIDGKFYQESGEIVKMLAQKYPDKSLSEKAQEEVNKWIDFNLEHCEKLFATEKHFGTYALSPQEKNYVEYGAGKKDLAWEKEQIQHLHQFLKTLDDHFAKKDNKAYFVGDKLTYADCALINWPWTLHNLAALKVKTRYPNLWEHHVQLRATNPEGAKEHYKLMPILGLVIGGKLLKTRGIFGWGHHIENPLFWADDQAKAAENATAPVEG